MQGGHERWGRSAATGWLHSHPESSSTAPDLLATNEHRARRAAITEPINILVASKGGCVGKRGYVARGRIHPGPHTNSNT